MSSSSHKDCIRIFAVLITIGFLAAYVIMHTSSGVHDEDIVSITDISNDSPDIPTTHQTTHQSTDKSDISHQDNKVPSTDLSSNDEQQTNDSNDELQTNDSNDELQTNDSNDEQQIKELSFNDEDMKVLHKLHTATTEMVASTTTAMTSSMVTTVPETKNEPKFQDPNSPVDNKKLISYIKTQCTKNGMKTEFKPIEKKAWPRLLLGNSKYKILYSSNPKSGSTSFKKFLIRLSGNTEDYDDIKNVHAPKKHQMRNELLLNAEREVMFEKKLDPLRDSAIIHSMAIKKLFKDYFVVGFIRNPFTRLISGFRDKVLRKKQKHMIGPINEDMRGTNYSVEESDVRMFHSFVKLVGRGQIRNLHFKSQYDAMKICTFPYNLLGQTETSTEQIKTMQKATGTENFEFPGSRSEEGKDKESTSDLVHRYFDEMPEETLNLFYSLYSFDFELTGYSKIHDENFPYIVLPTSNET